MHDLKKFKNISLKVLFGSCAYLYITSPFAAAQDGQPVQRIHMENVQRFSNALGEIQKYYVKPINDKDLFDNAIRGMLNGLDPHSSYLDEESFKELQTATSGEFGGLGIEVTMDDGVIKVITPIIDSPADKGGIKAGDYIIKLGDKAVQGLSLKEAVDIMRGKVGTKVDLTILRKGITKPLNFSITREKIAIKSVKSRLLDNNYGYIRLTQFQSLTSEDMEKQINKLKTQAGGKLNGLILDLRNNPGGLLDSAIQVSDSFLDNNQNGKGKIIVYTKGRLPGSKFTALSSAGDILNNAPIVVLINSGSASAAEIVAGALKDNKRALILGTRSFGKGSVQTVLPLDDKRAIKLTTALYYTPSGTSIQAHGIVPDIIIDDITVPKDAEKEDIFSNFSEENLNGHLINKEDEKVMVKPLNKQPKKEDLLHEDYQLYSALTILRGLSIAKQ